MPAVPSRDSQTHLQTFSHVPRGDLRLISHSFHEQTLSWVPQGAQGGAALRGAWTAGETDVS